MKTRFAVLLVVIAFCFVGYYVWQHQKEQKQLESGAFQCVGCDSPEQHARFLKENAGETVDGNSDRKNETARQSTANVAAGNATAGTPGYDSVNRDTPGGTAPAAYGGNNTAATQATSLAQPMMAPTAAQNTYQNSAPVSATMPPPAYDSQSANSGNSTHFAGSVNYQWYRQGSLTYRVDTVTGRSCIAYATMEEWHKQVVMNHGCGRAS